MCCIIYSVRYFEVRVKSILNRTKIRGIDYTLNPYVGCEHGCIYCFAGYVGERMGIDIPFGKYVGVKVNAREALLRDLRRIKGGVISMSSVTDPYQPIERERKITRSLLDVLRYFKGEVSILTKSPLILRDLDILKEMRKVEVGFSIALMNEDIRKFFEPGAPPVKERIEALRMLKKEKVKIWIFIAPYLPGATGEDLERILEVARDLEVSYVLLDRLNLHPRVKKKLDSIYSKRLLQFRGDYEAYKKDRAGYLEKVRMNFIQNCLRMGLNCRTVF